MSKTNTQFSIAIHLMTGLGYESREKVRTSSQLALSINTSPSFVRRTLSKLSKAGLVRTATGKSGSCGLAKAAGKISLLEIYKALDVPKIFSIHQYPVQKACPVSCHIHSSAQKVLNKTQKVFEESLAKIRLADVIAEIKNQ
jgi:Rrf2 family protein